MTSRLLIALLLTVSLGAQPSTVRIGVLGLFEPSELTLQASSAGPLRLSTGQAIEGQRIAQLQANGERVLINIDDRTFDIDRLTTSGVFTLGVPDKLTRQYQGSLEVTAHAGELQTVVTMSLEHAVGAAVAGEANLDGPREALLAQAVASRSYLSSGSRHGAYDFCDTTHCQYLTDSLDERARGAAAATDGIVLWANGQVFEALFTRSCDGSACPICARDPQHWTRTHALADVTELVRERTERARIAVVRRLGWDAVPSNAYEVTVDGDSVTFTGVGEGHGIGLCQRGAVGLARQGAAWREILERYYPLAVAERH